MIQAKDGSRRHRAPAPDRPGRRAGRVKGQALQNQAGHVSMRRRSIYIGGGAAITLSAGEKHHNSAAGRGIDQRSKGLRACLAVFAVAVNMLARWGA